MSGLLKVFPQNPAAQALKLLEYSADHISLINEQGRVVYSNRAVEMLLGYTPEEYAALKQEETVHPDDLQRAVEFFQTLVAQPDASMTIELRIRHKQGHYVWTESTMTNCLNDPDVRGLIANTRDVTHRKQMLHKVQEQHRIAEAMRDALAALTTSADSDQVMRQILDTAAQVVPSEAGSIILYENDQWRIGYLRGYPPAVEKKLKGFVFPADTLGYRRIRGEKTAYFIADTRLEPEWIELEFTAWIRASIGVPIELHGELIGALVADSAEPNHFTDADVVNLQAFASYAALALENALHVDQLEHKVIARTAEQEQTARTLRGKLIEERQFQQRLRAVHKVTISLTQTDDLDTFYRNVVELGRSDLGFDRIAFFLYDSARSLAVGTYGTDAYGETVNENHLVFDPHEFTGLLRRALDSGEVVSVDPETRLFSAGRFSGVGWNAASVIWGGDQPLGWLIIDNGHHQNPLRQSDLELLALYTLTVGTLLTQKRTAEALRESLEREKELNVLKSRFIATASHEFRTPLATILSSTELLSRYRGRMDEDKIDARLNRIVDQVRHVSDIMDDVLDISKMQANRVDFHPIPADLDALCREIVDEMQNRLDDARVVYRCDQSPLMVEVDIKLFRQSVINLVSNALKYSPDESKVMVHLSRVDSTITVSVIDQGIGIPPDDLKHLFEPFHRAANVGTIPGTGLGLAIVKEAVEIHGGVVDVQSRLDSGTTVTLRLPISPPRSA